MSRRDGTAHQRHVLSIDDPFTSAGLRSQAGAGNEGGGGVMYSARAEPRGAGRGQVRLNSLREEREDRGDAEGKRGGWGAVVLQTPRAGDLQMS